MEVSELKKTFNSYVNTPFGMGNQKKLLVALTQFMIDYAEKNPNDNKLNKKIEPEEQYIKLSEFYDLTRYEINGKFKHICHTGTLIRIVKKDKVYDRYVKFYKKNHYVKYQALLSFLVTCSSAKISKNAVEFLKQKEQKI